MTGAGQLPVPLQAAAAVCVPPLQLAARQEVDPPGRAQAMTLDPSQAPPQLEPSLAQAARPAWGAPATAVQLPTLPGTSQAWHCPPQAALQQTPSAQKPLAHCTLSWQVAPFISLPQLPVTQAWPLTHWLLVVQAS